MKKASSRKLVKKGAPMLKHAVAEEKPKKKEPEPEPKPAPAPAPEPEPPEEPETLGNAKVKSINELFLMAAEIEQIGRAIPTPGVTDSDAHGRRLLELAERLKELSGHE
jgi:hypothetical protein